MYGKPPTRATPPIHNEITQNPTSLHENAERDTKIKGESSKSTDNLASNISTKTWQQNILQAAFQH